MKEKADLLCVTLDESLTWSENIKFQSKKIAQKISMSRRLCDLCLVLLYWKYNYNSEFITLLFSNILTFVVQIRSVFSQKQWPNWTKYLYYRKVQLELYWTVKLLKLPLLTLLEFFTGCLFRNISENCVAFEFWRVWPQNTWTFFFEYVKQVRPRKTRSSVSGL